MVNVTPKLFDIVKLPKDFDELPKTSVPYFVAAREGTYLYKNTPIGVCLIPEVRAKFPNSFTSMGDFKNGYFRFSGPKLPKTVVDQAYSFFRKVFEANKLPNHKTGHCEAEVFILRNPKNEYSLFVPWQYTSSMGVNSIYDHADIPEDATIIGSIHSHCDFEAFHSSTDTADASDFNGLHITIGHVNTDKPSFAAMVMMNKLQFTYDIEAVVEDSNVSVVNIPEHWFKFIFDEPEKVIDRHFPTLTKEELTEFVKECGPKIYINNQALMKLASSQYDNWDDDWRWKGNGAEYGKYLQSTRWNDIFKRSFPIDWYESEAYGAKLTPQGFERALEKEMERLFEIAEKYGFYLDYALENMYETADQESR